MSFLSSLFALAEGILNISIVSLKNVSFEKAISTIRQKAKWKFLYNVSDIKNEPDITLNVKNADVKRVMDLLTEGRNLEYSIISGTITISRAEKHFKYDDTSSKQKEIIISGKVKDSSGKPLSCATIIL